MREIRFRAWDKTKKEMVFDGVEFELRCLQYEDDVDRQPSGHIGYSNMHYQWFEMMQFTGLQDKHGKDICEGDVVSWPARENLNEPRKEQRMVVTIEIDGGTLKMRPYINSEIEIIGNIYDNPELIDT